VIARLFFFCVGSLLRDYASRVVVELAVALDEWGARNALPPVCVCVCACVCIHSRNNALPPVCMYVFVYHPPVCMYVCVYHLSYICT
jgi:hypothetical protein